MVTGAMTTPSSVIKIVVIDDDPTGSQTVHSCPLLLRWDVETLRRGLRHSSPLFFVLANTRALPPDVAAARNREIINALALAIQAESWDPGNLILVSRGDSTLRGHGYLEPSVLAEELAQRFWPVHATFHVPAFLPGGRTTVGGVHLVHGEPVHTTPFACDHIFGFSTSHLDAWLEEKSGGAIKADSVLRLDSECLTKAAEARHGDVEGDSSDAFDDLVSWLEALDGNQSVVVDAEHQEQLDVLGAASFALRSRRHFLFRSAASLINGLLKGSGQVIGSQPLSTNGLVALRRCDERGNQKPGMVLVGSHVPLADQQIERLLQEPGCIGVELPVARIARVWEGPMCDVLLRDLESELQACLHDVLADGRTPVLYTTRGEMRFGNGPEAHRRRLAFGMELARLTGRLSSALVPEIGYLISKGGITSGILLAEAFDLSAVQLEGQLLPGLSIVRPIVEKDAMVSELPVITFPGNLGNFDTLRDAWLLMEGS